MSRHDVVPISSDEGRGEFTGATPLELTAATISRTPSAPPAVMYDGPLSSPASLKHHVATALSYFSGTQSSRTQRPNVNLVVSPGLGMGESGVPHGEIASGSQWSAARREDVQPVSSAPEARAPPPLPPAAVPSTSSPPRVSSAMSEVDSQNADDAAIHRRPSALDLIQEDFPLTPSTEFPGHRRKDAALVPERRAAPALGMNALDRGPMPVGDLAGAPSRGGGSMGLGAEVASAAPEEEEEDSAVERVGEGEGGGHGLGGSDLSFDSGIYGPRLEMREFAQRHDVASVSTRLGRMALSSSSASGRDPRFYDTSGGMPSSMAHDRPPAMDPSMPPEVRRQPMIIPSRGGFDTMGRRYVPAMEELPPYEDARRYTGEMSRHPGGAMPMMGREMDPRMTLVPSGQSAELPTGEYLSIYTPTVAGPAGNGMAPSVGMSAMMAMPGLLPGEEGYFPGAHYGEGAYLMNGGSSIPMGPDRMGMSMGPDGSASSHVVYVPSVFQVMYSTSSPSSPMGMHRVPFPAAPGSAGGMPGYALVGSAPSAPPPYGSTPPEYSRGHPRGRSRMEPHSRGGGGGMGGYGLSGGGGGGGRSFPDEGRSRRSRASVDDIYGRIFVLSQDQQGSRSIQQKLETATEEEKTRILEEILPHSLDLMRDVFGNYVIQKLLEHGTEDHGRRLLAAMRGHVLELSLQMYGCRVIQKALEFLPLPLKLEIVRELEGHVVQCVKDQNGNHVIQKAIECIPPEHITFVIADFLANVVIFSKHSYGCRVVQRILEHGTEEQKVRMLDEIRPNAVSLSQDQFGNYVVQHVLENGTAIDRSIIVQAVSSKIQECATHKFASNVVEKCFEFGTDDDRRLILSRLLVGRGEDSLLFGLMKDQYGNYVVQRFLLLSREEQRERLCAAIRPYVSHLRRLTFGKHIVAFLEKS